MTQQIQPQEFHLLQDNPIIRTKCPQADITDEMIVRRVKNGNLVAGDIVRVQCMNSDYTHLLAECEYRVTSRRSELKTHEINDRDTRQVEEITFRVQRWTEWRPVGHPADRPAVPAPLTGERYVDGDAKATWNLGRKGYEIKVGDRVVGFHPDKDTANRIAAGELPLPDMA